MYHFWNTCNGVFKGLQALCEAGSIIMKQGVLTILLAVIFCMPAVSPALSWLILCSALSGRFETLFVHALGDVFPERECPHYTLIFNYSHSILIIKYIGLSVPTTQYILIYICPF